MKKQKQTVCPGCSRHCTENSIRCKKGRAYFAGLSEKAAKGRHGCKWEKSVEEGGVLWKLLFSARRIKRALREEAIGEAGLLEALSETERTQLTAILARLEEQLDKREKQPDSNRSGEGIYSSGEAAENAGLQKTKNRMEDSSC